jgi:hypothetical protein
METDKEKVKETFDAVQVKLETLQGCNESFLFLTEQEGRIVISGVGKNMLYTLLVAMMRSSYLRDLVLCAASTAKKMPDDLKKYIFDNSQRLSETDSFEDLDNWISVKEHLPKDGQTVVAYDSRTKLHTVTYIQSTGKWFDSNDSNIVYENIVFWVPIPKMPGASKE